MVSEEKNVAAGGTFNVHIRNPSGTGKICVLQDISITTKGAASIRVVDDFSGITDGSDVLIQNGFLDTSGETDEGPFEAFVDSSFTATSTHAVGVIGSGGGGPNTIGGRASYATLMMDEGREIVIESTNDDGSNAHDHTITVTMYEINSD